MNTTEPGWWLNMKLGMWCYPSRIGDECLRFSSIEILIRASRCEIHVSIIHNGPDRVIRLATDLRFVDASKSYDTVLLLTDWHSRWWSLFWQAFQRWNKFDEVGDGFAAESSMHHRKGPHVSFYRQQ